MVVVTRNFVPESDRGIILERMPKEIYYETHSRRGRFVKSWFEAFHEYLEPVLSRGNIFIATTEEDTNFILGFSIFDGNQLEFVYVKDEYRKQGIGKMLVGCTEFTSINDANMTKIGRQILLQTEKLGDKRLETKKCETEADFFGKNKTLEGLRAGGIPVVKVTFQSAILSGMNQAEGELNSKSNNAARRPESMTYTPHGVIIEHNGELSIVPLSNVIKADIIRPEEKALTRER